MSRSLTLHEEYYVGLDTDDFTIPPIEMGSVTISWHDDQFVLTNTLNHDMAELVDLTGTVNERQQLADIVARYLSLVALVTLTNNLIRVSAENPQYAEAFSTPDGLHYWSFNAMLWTCDLVGLTIIGVDDDTRTFALTTA